jgi:glutamyl-tRNA reductase
MRYEKGESYEHWAERVHKYEYGHALQRIANGEDTDLVLEQMSKRVVEKMMYPLRLALKNVDKPYDASVSRKRYEESYLNRRSEPPV